MIPLPRYTLIVVYLIVNFCFINLFVAMIHCLLVLQKLIMVHVSINPHGFTLFLLIVDSFVIAKYVCCCVECPNVINELIECRPSWLCGETVTVRPCSEVMGFKLDACWLCNCCDLCGIKNGEPLCLRGIPGGNCLQAGESEKLAKALNQAHLEWRTRVSKKM